MVSERKCRRKNQIGVNNMAKIQLQGIGKVEAKKVNELNIGDVIMWNFGYTSTVVDLIPTKSGKSIKCMLRSNQDGVIRDRTMRSDRLVAIG